MQEVECSGTPFQIGHKHGSLASAAIAGSIDFYADMFQKNNNKSWAQVLEIAGEFESNIQSTWPRYYEEMQGIAAASSQPLRAIIALNVRTEIAFGLWTDGCTSLYSHSQHDYLLGQNWDWDLRQKANLVLLTIVQPAPLPTIKMVTEAGIIGKIGLNSAGIGACFNAIRAPGMDPSRMPAHLGLRRVLDSQSVEEAAAALEERGMASSAYILIGSRHEATGVEFTSTTVVRQPTERCGPNGRTRIVHTNHLLQHHAGIAEPAPWLADSTARIQRMKAMTDKFANDPLGLDKACFARLFEDCTGSPDAIDRSHKEGSSVATLFNIVMDLEAKTAVVRLGRPSAPEARWELSFEHETASSAQVRSQPDTKL